MPRPLLSVGIYAITIRWVWKNKSNIIQKISETHTPNDEYENFFYHPYRSSSSKVHTNQTKRQTKSSVGVKNIKVQKFKKAQKERTKTFLKEQLEYIHVK